MTLTIDAKDMYYRELNERLREAEAAGERHIRVINVRGQRYIGTGLTASDLLVEIEGIPGEDLAFCMGGPTVIVHGHGQNAIANTMDSGTVVVHGLGGDALAYGMRGGKLFIRDHVGYRVGIHMKEYRDLKPAVVVGTTSGDFLGEYMAGGTLIVLNRNNETENVAGQADKTLATGIHGGEIFIFQYEIPSYMPGIGARLFSPDKADRERIRPLVEEYCRHFGLDPEALLARELVKIMPAGSRPFGRFYYPAYPVNTGLKPVQCEKVSPCEANCPIGIPTGRFLRHLRLNEVKDALALIDEYTPFRYSNCGFICPHLCMEACSRRRVDFPVRTDELAHAFCHGPLQMTAPPNGKRIAVIGAGPSGLSAAYFLTRLGYTVEVFEAEGHAGGKMYQVVSRRRLPLADLEQDLERIASLGIKFHFNTTVDRTLFEKIVNEFDHTIVATGAHRPLVPEVKGKELVRAGLHFLKAYNSGKPVKVGEHAVLVGGGDVAIDGIEVLVELGMNPSNITVIDIKTPAAKASERQKWQAAGVRFIYPVFLQEVTEEGAVVKDQADRLSVIPGDVIAFISEVPQMDFLPESITGQLDKRGFFACKDGCFATSDSRVSIIGDAAGLGLVANSIAKARICSYQVDAALSGKEYSIPEREVVNPEHLKLDWNVPVNPAQVPVQEEYNRCLHCGVCVQCDDCVNACPRGARVREGYDFILDLEKCGGCGSCAAACKGGVIRMVTR